MSVGHCHADQSLGRLSPLLLRPVVQMRTQVGHCPDVRGVEKDTNKSSWEKWTWLTTDELLARYSPGVVDDNLKHMFPDQWRPNPDAPESLIAVQYRLKCEDSEQTTESDNKSRGMSFRADVNKQGAGL